MSSFDVNENMLLSLPPALAMRASSQFGGGGGGGGDNDLITTQNYMDKYRDMQKLLADEKKTNEELKRFYSVLKTDHTRLKNESVELKTQVTTLIEENKMMQEKYKAMFEKMQQETRRKQLFIEELKNRELDDVKLERIKDDLTQQIEAPYKDIVRQLEQALQAQQGELDKVRADAQLMRASSQRDKAEHHNMLDQLRAKHDMELAVMRRERDTLRAKLQETNQSEINKIKEALRENNQLRVRVKALVDENDELREKTERAESHNGLLVRNHSKALTDYSTRISVLESEKESLKQQAESSQKETLNLNNELAENQRRLNELERENTTLKLKVDEIQHTAKKDVANMKLDIAKEKGAHNRAIEVLNNEIEDLKQKVEMANGNVETHKKMLEEKERELAKIMNNINEENWSKITELTNEKIEMEAKYQLMTKDFEFKLGTLQLEKDKSDEKLRAFEKQRDEIINENGRMRALVANAESARNELEREQERTRDLQRKCQKLENEMSANASMEHELTEINMRLKNEISFCNQEITRFKDQMNRLRDEYENKVIEVKNQQTVEKNELKFKVDELQAKLNRANAKLNDFKKFHEKKKKQYQAYSKALKQKSDAINARLRELQLREHSSGQTVSVQAYNKLKAHLNLLVKKHEAFKDMLLNGGNFNDPNLLLMPKFNSTSTGGGSFPATTSGSFENKINHLEQPLSVDLMSANLASLRTAPRDRDDCDLQKKFDEISNKLDVLTSTQNEHLKNISIMTSPTPRPTTAASATKAVPLSEIINEARRQDASVVTATVPPPPSQSKRQMDLIKMPVSSSSSSSSSSSAASSPLRFSNKPPSTTASATAATSKAAAAATTGQSKLNKSQPNKQKSDDEDEDTVSDRLAFKKSPPSKPVVAARKERNSSYEDDFENSVKSDL